MKELKGHVWALMLVLFAPAAFAQDGNDLDIGAPSDGPLALIGSFFQELIDFIGGPGVLFVVFVSGVAAIALWVAAPKAGGAAIAMLMRVLVGGIIIFNFALVINWMQGF